MSEESAKEFLQRVKSDRSFRIHLSEANSQEERHAIIASEGFRFSKEQFDEAKSQLSDWDLTMIENECFHRSDKRVSGLEFCCCCAVGGLDKEPQANAQPQEIASLG